MSEREGRAETLVEAALRVLKTADPFDKARLGDSVASQWLQGTITQPYDSSLDLPVPERPARLSKVRTLQKFTERLGSIIQCPLYALRSIKCRAETSLQVRLVSPSLMPKLGKAGSLQSRQAIVHSLVHTESWAIDLSWVLFVALSNLFPCFLFLEFFHVKLLVWACHQLFL